MYNRIYNLVYLLIVVVLFSCGNSVTKNTEESVLTTNSNNEVPKDINSDIKTSPNTSTLKNIPYKIIWSNTSLRYDGAATYIVVTNENSPQRMHDLVNVFAHKLQKKKFSLVVFDDKNAARIYKASRYAANETNRLSTKSELEEMGKHIVGSYDGELETNNGKPYEILYGGFGYSEERVENFEPNL